jgi:hypothetical protein
LAAIDRFLSTHCPALFLLSFDLQRLLDGIFSLQMRIFFLFLFLTGFRWVGPKKIQKWISTWIKERLKKD